MTDGRAKGTDPGDRMERPALAARRYWVGEGRKTERCPERQIYESQKDDGTKSKERPVPEASFRSVFEARRDTGLVMGGKPKDIQNDRYTRDKRTMEQGPWKNTFLKRHLCQFSRH